jgi:hypothetical protein
MPTSRVTTSKAPTSKPTKPRARSAGKPRAAKSGSTTARKTKAKAVKAAPWALVPASAQQSMYATLRGWQPELWEDADGTEVAALAAGLTLGTKDAIIHPWAGRAKLAERLFSGTVSAVEELLAEDLTNTPKATVLLCAGALEADSDPRPVLAFAARHKLPILFLVSNRYPSAKSPNLDLRALHADFGIPVFSTDAHDAIAVFRIATEAVHNARHGRGPCVIEALTHAPHKLNAHTALSLLADYMERHGNPPRTPRKR